MNITSRGNIRQRGAPLSKVMTNDLSMDEIITFDMSLNDETMVFATKQNRIVVIKLLFDNEFKEYMLPMGCKIVKEYPTQMKTAVRCLVLDNTVTMVAGGTGNGEIRV
ncbi:hypothetical protein RFI_36866 [Reticulomyxa filosa]|uniref:Uncharacterized protein n=1 Tax=Reticulomyxa filosa TaxID=46433 RepID=X6LG72_RETFI|nr:hypothetical protein RFI_36866 [Reticulomyxa filosa]|eukprot:ETO00574.1 hypothetical protein RFI_36866 [Reticulomyxa filosa]